MVYKRRSAPAEEDIAMHHRPIPVLVLLVLLLSACTSSSTLATPTGSIAEAAPTGVQDKPAPTSAVPAAAEPTLPPGPTDQPGQTEQPAALVYPEFSGGGLVFDRGDLFTGSGLCTGCHSAMIDATGKDVTLGRNWSATMMANAGKDPYWLATVRSEVELEPELRAVIEQKCATCHMPMAEVTALAAGEATLLLDEGFSSPDHWLHNLARDGVSCTLCHQVEADNFGEPVSYSGGFAIDLAIPNGSRLSYGPYQVGRQLVTIMQSSSGYIPQQGTQISQSELCGTCHNLSTPFVDAQGQVAGEFAEQAIYSEWANSAYHSVKACMDCHMPVAEGAIQLSITGGPARSPFSQHTFIGSNAFMLNVLRYFGEEIGVTTSSATLAQGVLDTETLMGTQTATVWLENMALSGSTLSGDIVVESLVGHKFPGGYPSRRAWLHITVLDAAGNIVFESGAVSPDGRISGNDNDEDDARYEPHYTALSAPDQVQIYEVIMLNSDGEVTTTLLRAAAYAKDNRLLPQGFDLEAATTDILVFGEAAQDSDFIGGADRIGLQIDLGSAVGPFTVQVELLYQSIGYRWAQNLLQDETAEAQTFGGYYATVPNLPLVAALTETVVQP
jgi:hypothetical protein